MIQEYPALYEQLHSSKRLLPAIDQYAIELKTLHNYWKDQLSLRRLESHPAQLASEAMELAVETMTSRLRYASPADAEEPLSLDAAMSFIRLHSRIA
jgi:hypothetical protein